MKGLAMDEKEFNLTLTLGEGFQFDTEFDGEKMPNLLLDEPEPLGEGEGPNAARVLGAAIGNCLSASLLFCLRKARVGVDGMRTEVRGTIGRNEKGRFRVERVDVRLLTEIPPEDQSRVDRCLKVFEDFCIVSGSVRKGLDIGVEVDVLNPPS
ncbi:MAG: OsmC family protein [Gemmatimonadota bacterium]